MAYRAAHVAQAAWCIRPVLRPEAWRGRAVVLIAPDLIVAEGVAADLFDAGADPDHVRVHLQDAQAWRAAGLDVVATPQWPADADCIDYLFFVHDRHDGNKAAARQYLAWETGLVGQLDAREREELGRGLAARTGHPARAG